MGKRFIYACKYGVIYIELIFMECLITRWHVVLIPYNEFGPNHSRITDIAGKICDTIFVYCSWVAVVRTLHTQKARTVICIRRHITEHRQAKWKAKLIRQ